MKKKEFRIFFDPTNPTEQEAEEKQLHSQSKKPSSKKKKKN